MAEAAHSFVGRHFFVGGNLVATILIGVATQKWGTEVPNWLFIFLCLIPVALWLAYIWTLPSIKKHRQWVYTYPRMSLVVMILVGALAGICVGGGIGTLLWLSINKQSVHAETNSKNSPSPETSLPSPPPLATPEIVGSQPSLTTTPAMPAKKAGIESKSQSHNQNRKQPSTVNQTMTNSPAGIQAGGDVTIGQKPSPTPTEKDRKP